MGIATITVSASRPPPSVLFSSCHSSFFSNTTRVSLLNRTKPQTLSLFVGRPRRRNGAATVRKGLTCNSLFGLGVPELVVIAGVAALVFGPKKLPEVGKSIGKTVKSFQQAAKEFESELKKEPDSIAEPAGEKQPTAISEEKQDANISSSKDSV
ncbi:hypothetical protein SLE2022_128690 [Rubroshorea leprosula]